MDLAQKANRAKRDLEAAAHKPEATSIKHAIESFEAFADAVVEEIGKLKAAAKTGSPDAETVGDDDLVARPGGPVDPAPTASDAADRAARETATT